MLVPLISGWLATALTGRSGQLGRLVLFDLCQLAHATLATQDGHASRSNATTKLILLL